MNSSILCAYSFGVQSIMKRCCTVTAKKDLGPFQELRYGTKALQVLLFKRRTFVRGMDDACLVQHARHAMVRFDSEFKEQHADI